MRAFISPSNFHRRHYYGCAALSSRFPAASLPGTAGKIPSRLLLHESLHQQEDTRTLLYFFRLSREVVPDESKLMQQSSGSGSNVTVRPRDAIKRGPNSPSIV